MSTATEKERIFTAAAELANPQQRKAFLDAACGGDAQLRCEVEKLLAHDDESSSFLEAPAVAIATDAFPPIAEGPGTMIGHYKLLQKIGEGGFGVVYMAEQQEPVRRKVALKIIKPGMDTREVIARFESERQALALMDHPNIARVLDAGATESSRPYFVMELVKGVPITEYCDKNHLSADARLQLFIAVCNAVQHAHQKGVIHRDLKPTNVMVTLHDGKPVPKVIDFGVAKATSQQLTEKTLFTAYGQMVGTPAYMSPEQAEMSGLDIDTRSDIYSLGVLLYELLTGSTPFDGQRLRAAGYAEMQRIIREEEPPRPSTRVSTLGESVTVVSNHRSTDPKTLRQMLRGDLDLIVMKAMEKERSRRFDTPSAFADDIQRYLTHEAILARPASAGYRLKKFVQRNSAAVATAAAIAGLLFVGMGVTTWLAIRERAASRQAHQALDRAREAEATANKERDQKGAAEKAALLEAEKARAFSKFLTEDILEQAHPDKNAPMDRLTLLEVVDRASAQVGEGFAGQPLVEAEIRKTLGKVYFGLAQFKQAENHLRAALDINRRLLGETDPETLRTMSDLGHVLSESGRRDEARELMRKSVEGLTATRGADDPDTLTAKTWLVCNYAVSGRITEAVSLCEETARLTMARLGPGHRDTWNSMINLGIEYQATGRLEEGLAKCQEALQHAQSKLGKDHPGTLLAITHASRAYQRARRPDEAVAHALLAVSISEAKLGQDSLTTLAKVKQLAVLYRYLGRLDEATQSWQRALQVSQSKLGLEHRDTVLTALQLGNLYLQTKQAEKTATLFEDSLPHARSTLGNAHRDTLSMISGLSLAYLQSKRAGEAVQLLEDTLGQLRAEFGADNVETLTMQRNLVAALEIKNDFDTALTLNEELVTLAKAKLGLEHIVTLLGLRHLAARYCASNRIGDAIALLEGAAPLLKEKSQTNAHARALMTVLADSYRYAGRMDEAIGLYEDLIRVCSGNSGFDSFLASMKTGLGIALVRQGKYAAAEPLLREALLVREKLMPLSWNTASTKSALGSALAGQQNYTEAEPLLLAAWERLNASDSQVPVLYADRVTDTLKSLIQLNELTDNPRVADKWHAQLDTVQARISERAGVRPTLSPDSPANSATDQ